MNPGTLYRENAVRGASNLRLVALLYEQMIADLRQAVAALEHHQVELRTNKINHAILVIAYLESTLNKDAGGKVALELERYYEYLRGNLITAQGSSSEEILRRQITDLVALREAWSQVEYAQAPVEPRVSSARPVYEQE